MGLRVSMLTLNVIPKYVYTIYKHKPLHAVSDIVYASIFSEIYEFFILLFTLQFGFIVQILK